MANSIRMQTERMIAASKTSLEARDWWQSDSREDVNNRRHVEVMWREILTHCDEYTHGLESVERLLGKLGVIGETDKFVIGYSVGFKKPGPGEIRWVDVKGAEEPLAASQTVKMRDDVKRWLREGYREYGISAMTEHRKREYVPVASSVHSTAPTM